MLKKGRYQLFLCLFVSLSVKCAYEVDFFASYLRNSIRKCLVMYMHHSCKGCREWFTQQILILLIVIFFFFKNLVWRRFQAEFRTNLIKSFLHFVFSMCSPLLIFHPEKRKAAIVFLLY
jgi:ABC-type iron transport system FetAB permease component